MREILNYATSHRWAMHGPTLERFCRIYEEHLRGKRVARDEVQAVVEKRDREVKIEDARVDGGVAVIPISGVIAPHASMVNGMSTPQGTSTAAIRKHIRAAVADPDVHTLLLDIESPGGSVQGVDELASEIMAARESKRIVAHTDSLMASAAYWLGAQAHEVYATKTADVGSIGVYAVVDDYSELYEAAGIKTHVISSGGVKGAGVKGAQVTDEHLKEFARGVMEINGIFLDAVQAGRAVDAKKAKSWNTGQTWLGGAAAEMGLVDGVETFGALLKRLQMEQGLAMDHDEDDVDEEDEALAAQAGAISDVVAKKIAARAAGTGLAEEGGTMGEKREDEAAKVDLEAVRAEGAAAERARVKAIREAAHDSQRELADHLCEEGATAESARQCLHEDLLERYEQLEQAAQSQPEPKAEKPKGKQLYGEANTVAVFGGSDEAEGPRAPSSSTPLEKRNLADMSSEDFDIAVAAEWKARREELEPEFMSFDGFKGCMIEKRAKGVRHG